MTNGIPYAENSKETLAGIDWTVKWNILFDDYKLNQFIETGFVVFDDIFSTTAILALQQESGFINYKDANLTDGNRIEQIRGDKTHWITKKDSAGSNYIDTINDLAGFCNRVFYAGIKYSEAHYAYYPAGFGYQWHSDNPIGRDERILSAVFYLNDDWSDVDGGALEIVDKQGTHHLKTPQANRLVLFDSNLQHQVQIAHRKRFSIATWMRR